jgi:glutathione peroxidase
MSEQKKSEQKKSEQKKSEQHQSKRKTSDSIYDIEVTTLNGETKTLEDMRGKVMLIVNTASKCGFTPQYKGLEALHEAHAAEGLAILGFPCNQFGGQEPGTEAEIGEFCELNYGVRFPMHAKVDVNGDATHPLFQKLKQESPGLFGSEAIKWNFTKFLVDREGRVVERFAPQTTPEKLEAQIESLL